MLKIITKVFMKKILSWIEEERIAIIVLLLGIGIVLNSQNAGIIKNFPPPTITLVFSGMFLYGALLLILLHLSHKLYLKLKD
jgi:hypothetical protein